MSDTAQDVQAREVETSQQGARWSYRVTESEVRRSVSGVIFREVQSPEVAAAVRRIAELEQERECYRKLLEDMPPTTWVDFNKRVKEALGSP